MPTAAVDDTPFKWDVIPVKDRDWLMDRTESIRELAHRQVIDTVRIGQMLEEAKAKLKHGSFRVWVQKELRFSHDTERRYRQVASAFGSFEKTQFASFDRSALYVLAQSDVPQSARELAVQLANDGTKITHALAKEIVDGEPEDDTDEPEEPDTEQSTDAEPDDDEYDDSELEDDEEAEAKDNPGNVTMRGCMTVGCDRQFPKDGINHFCPRCRQARLEEDKPAKPPSFERLLRFYSLVEKLADEGRVTIERVEDTDYHDAEKVYNVSCRRPPEGRTKGDDGGDLPTNIVTDDLYVAMGALDGSEEELACSGPCGQTKKASEFSKNADNPSGRNYRCRKCESQRRGLLRIRKKEQKAPRADD